MKKTYLKPEILVEEIDVEKGFAGSYDHSMQFDGNLIEGWEATIEYKGDATEDDSDFWD